MPKTPQKGQTLQRILKLPFRWLFVLLLVFGLLTSALSLKPNTPTYAAPITNLNFQARLQTASGGIVSDGFYNIQFNLYSVSTAGSTLWTESHLVTNTQGLRIKNGYFSASLGSITSFPGTIDWDQELWLGMTVRGTGNCAFGACTPTDAEMSPRFKLTAVPYAFKAAQAAAVASAATSTASTNSNAITINSGNATGATSNSGNISIDSGTATGTAGQLLFGNTNTSAILLGRNGIVTTIQGDLTLSGGTNYGIYFRDGSGNFENTAAGTTGQCLVANTGAAPTWGGCGTGGGLTSFTLAGTSGTSQTITDSNTLTVAAG
ncbi:MAG: hypothetical protein M3Q79_00530, partial [bacterium]|nr:hypothetical protein [bacterium]